VTGKQGATNGCGKHSRKFFSKNSFGHKYVYIFWLFKDTEIMNLISNLGGSAFLLRCKTRTFYGIWVDLGSHRTQLKY